MKVINRNDKTHVSLDGELTVARATDLKDVLSRSLDKGETIVINLDKVTGVDLSCLQLLCSAHLTASKSGKTLTIKDSTIPAFHEARETAGLIYSKPCQLVSTGDCLWVDGGK